MKQIYRKTLQVIVITALLAPILTISIKAIAGQNPCNPFPVLNPTGRVANVSCTYKSITYTYDCCNDVFIGETCSGMIQICPEPQE